MRKRILSLLLCLMLLVSLLPTSFASAENEAAATEEAAAAADAENVPTSEDIEDAAPADDAAPGEEETPSQENAPEEGQQANEPEDGEDEGEEPEAPAPQPEEAEEPEAPAAVDEQALADALAEEEDDGVGRVTLLDNGVMFYGTAPEGAELKVSGRPWFSERAMKAANAAAFEAEESVFTLTAKATISLMLGEEPAQASGKVKLFFTGVQLGEGDSIVILQDLGEAPAPVEGEDAAPAEGEGDPTVELRDGKLVKVFSVENGNLKITKQGWATLYVDALPAAFTLNVTFPVTPVEKVEEPIEEPAEELEEIEEPAEELEEIEQQPAAVVEPAAPALSYQELSKSCGRYGAVVSGYMPEGARLVVTFVNQSAAEQVLEAANVAGIAGELANFVALDVTIVDGEGKIWQPEELGVTVKLTGFDVGGADRYGMVHVLDDAAAIAASGSAVALYDELVASTMTAASAAAQEATGEADAVYFEDAQAEAVDEGLEADVNSLSTFIGYTVDFHNGDVVFSIPGESSILLSELFAELGYDYDVADVESVSFSDPTLVQVEAVEGDWLLTSIAPFDTDETLTIVFKDGTAILQMLVTDAVSTPLTFSGNYGTTGDWSNTDGVARVYQPKIHITYPDGGTSDASYNGSVKKCCLDSWLTISGGDYWYEIDSFSNMYGWTYVPASGTFGMPGKSCIASNTFGVGTVRINIVARSTVITDGNNSYATIKQASEFVQKNDKTTRNVEIYLDGTKKQTVSAVFPDRNFSGNNNEGKVITDDIAYVKSNNSAYFLRGDVPGGSNTVTTSGNNTYRIWLVTRGTIVYHNNGGSGKPGNQYKYYDIDLTLSSTQPTRTGYNFRGWATSQARANAGTVDYAAGASYTSNIASGGTVDLYAVWAAKTDAKYTVNYYIQGTTTSVPGKSSVTRTGRTYGTTYYENADEWVGSYQRVDSGQKSVVASYDASVTFYYKLVTHTVQGTIDNGGTVTNSSQTVNHGANNAAMVFTPAANYKITGITINGVAQTVSNENSYTFPAQAINENKTVVVTTARANFTLTGTIDNGGTVTNASQSVAPGASSLAMVFTPATGYKITGITINGAAQTVNSEDSYTFPAQAITADTTVAVTTAKKTFQVICEDRVGSVSGELLGTQTAKTYEYGATAKGSDWGTSSPYGTYRYVSDTSATVNGATTVYRIFELVTHSVTGTIDNGGTVTNASQTVTHGQQNTPMVFTPATGYKITGITINGASQTVTSEDSYTFAAQAITADTAVAVTTASITYTITYDPGNAGTNATGMPDPNPKSYTVEDSFNLAGEPSWPGHEFTGWKLAANVGNWTAATFAASAPVSSGMYGNVVLVAQWETVEFHVIYKANGGEGADKDDTRIISDPYNVKPIGTGADDVNFSYAGRSFEGWNTQADGQGTAYAVGTDLSTLANDLTLYAQWERIATTVTVKVQVTGSGADLTKRFTGTPAVTLYEGGAYGTVTEAIADQEIPLEAYSLNNADPTKSYTGILAGKSVCISDILVPEHYDLEIKVGSTVINFTKSGEAAVSAAIPIPDDGALEIVLTYSRDEVPDTGISSGADAQMLGLMLFVFGLSGLTILALPKLRRRREDET